jgi:hypothetical protein
MSKNKKNSAKINFLVARFAVIPALGLNAKYAKI